MNSSKSPPVFQIGQCWTSEGEPELGIGFVKALDATSVAIEFPTPSVGRLYRVKSAPLRRLEFRATERIQSKSGSFLVVDRIEVRKNLNWYIAADGTELCESEISPKLTLQRPMERYLAAQWDPLKAFKLRRRTLEYYHERLRSPARGMIGPTVQLLPHQAYVTQEISKRGLPRALLADEVGLGKTIEAAWILHRLLATQRIRRILIVVPESLVNQWFVELFKRFHLSFWVPASQVVETLEEGDIDEQERVILSTETFAGYFAQGFLKAEDWDLVIVDEAHRIAWSKEQASPEYQALEALAVKTPGLLLLTATPEQLGLEGHYSRLHLIDPVRFSDLEKFKTEHESYLKVVRLADSLLSPDVLKPAQVKALTKQLEGLAEPSQIEAAIPGFKAVQGKAKNTLPLARRSLLMTLIDHFGTGRIYFRNSRAVVELSNFAFPERKLEKHLLKGAKANELGESMITWLAEFGKAHASEKTLLICSSVKQVVEWEKKLRDDYALKVVAFHEDLSLLARDRNAAYFEDPKGATLLLCSELGGEGRNFQHATHLILADLPLDPDVLEQRIGRLDRIGQVSDISIHVPYTAKSHTERLLQWHDEVFHSFEAPPVGARAVYETYREALISVLEKSVTKTSESEFQKLIVEAKEAYQQQLKTIEAGRDRLIEINSFDPEFAPKLVETLQNAERATELKDFFEDLLDSMGLLSDDLDADSIFIDPGQGQYVSYFPGLPPTGLSTTFSRQKALKRSDLAFMTWDHPMVNETLSQLVSQEFGNVSVASWPKTLLVAECNFVLEPSAGESKWYAEEFFPSTPIRIVMEATGRDLTTQLDWGALSKELSPITPTIASFVKKLPGERVRGMLNKALAQAKGMSAPLKSQALIKMNETINSEIARLKAFKAKNQLVSDSEIKWWEERKYQLEKAFMGSQVRLDSFLLVVPAQWGAQ